MIMDENCERNSEQERIVRQLKDMFTSLPEWRLREVCKINNYNLDSCIDNLMNIRVNRPPSIKEQIRQQHDNSGEDTFTKAENRIGSLIKKGYRVMILMRGPPGVGKSYLARSLVKNFADLEGNDYRPEDFIFSTDDYFYNANGVYNYNPANLTNAHDFNQQRVADKANSGLSPIIVDNTNMKIWEMLPYVKQAVRNNYLLEILEPKTAWRKSIKVLAQKNKHGVTAYRIQHIIDKYEKCSADTLIKMLKNTKYNAPLPQLRLLPPLRIENDESATNTEKEDQKGETNKDPRDWYTFSSNLPKEQREKFMTPSKSVEDNQPPTQSAPDINNPPEETTPNVWKPYEAESLDFWGIKRLPQPNFQLPNETNQASGAEKTLLDVLREGSDEAARAGDTVQEIKKQSNYNKFKRHSINCPNENETFVTLRQIYPNKRVSGLWDLFVKCNGDVDWAVDILLKEDELERMRDDDDFNYQTDDDENYKCSCNEPKKGNEEKNFENILSVMNMGNSKPQRQRSRNTRNNHVTNPALLEVKETIENCFVLGDDQYSDRLLKVRNFRSGLNSNLIATSSNVATESYENFGNQAEEGLTNRTNGETDNTGKDDTDDEDDEEEVDMTNCDDDMLEMSLGEQLVQQLVDTFKSESSLEEHISPTTPLDLKVFMPRSLAKQLYMLWVESAYNHMEEERQKLIQEDEEFARLLKNPKYEEYKQSPSNLREILDMEYAWKLYNDDKQENEQREANIEKVEIPNNLASHLTQIKLCETFPDIPRETLIDILASNNSDYNATVSILNSTMQNADANQLEPTTHKQLMDCALQEQDMINQQVQKQMDEREERLLNNWNDGEIRSCFMPEEAKRLALREFEESRNLAAHHCQLKAECYRKAKEAIQSGNGGVAVYYSQIANLHKKKIDMYNHRAANCIMDAHKYTQNNPDLLDLHYLHLIEALGCLDLFLDRHITGLRVASRNYKHVFIITGRGKHSAGGVSTIKYKVKARLKERSLRWSEVNPGLLKVKIFSGSRHSKNI